MGFYYQPNEACKDAPKPDEMAAYFKKEISKYREQLKVLVAQRDRIINDFGAKYAEDIDRRIDRINHDIRKCEYDMIVAKQTDEFLKRIIEKLNLKYMFGVKKVHENETDRPFSPTRDYSMYKFGSNSGGRIIINQHSWHFSNNDHIHIALNYIFGSHHDTATLLDLEYSTNDNTCTIKQDPNFAENSIIIKPDNYDPYQYTEFKYAIDIVKELADEFVKSYKSVKDQLELEESHDGETD